MIRGRLSFALCIIVSIALCPPTRSQDDEPLVTLGTGGVHFLQFSPDGTLFMAVPGGSVSVWNPQNGDVVRLVDPVGSIALSLDGRLLAVGYGDKVTLYDAKSGGHLRDIGLPYSAMGLALSPDGTRLARGVRGEATVEILDIETGERLDSVDLENGHGIFSLVFGPDGSRLLVSYYYVVVGPMSSSYTVFQSALVSFPDKKILASYGSNEGAPVAYSSDGSLYAVIPGNVHVYDAETFSFVCEIPARGVIAAGLAFSPDGTKLLHGPALHDARTGELLREFPTDPYRSAVAYSPDGNKVAIEDTRNGTVTIWDVSDLNTAVEDWPERKQKVRRVDGVK